MRQRPPPHPVGDATVKGPALFPAKGFPPDLAVPFAAFWAAYPRRVPNPRAVAALAFAKAVKQGATTDQLIAAASAYAAQMKAKGTVEEFIVHASTFLRQQRFLDYLETTEEAPPAPAEPVHDLWPELLAHMDASDFRAWIGRCEVASRDGNALVLAAPSTFIAARIRQDFVQLLQRVLECRVTVTVETAR
ncbi:MAG: hypothetical protein JWP29_5680 [Rhodoferax sp.]|nr:hypothetical protein [Rhodoferax sp.]